MSLEPVPIDDEDGESDSSGHDSRGGPLATLRGQSSGATPHLRWILPIVAVLLGVAIYELFVLTREQPQTQDPIVPSPLVRVQTVEPQDVRFRVVSRGIVAPRTESDLVAEVRGRVLSISPQLVVGGFFAEGDELLRLDDREHRIARDRARATVDLRQSEARLATADADRRRQLRSRGAASAADLEQFENRERVARASLEEARAALAQAEFDLERTIVRAPFDGRVRERHVDVGQFVSPGTKLGRIFAVDYAEIRLPIQIDELAYLDAQFVGLDRRVELEREARDTPVHLTGRLGGRDWSWDARLVRAEAAIDEQTRMLHVVARVDDPYLLAAPGDPSPDTLTEAPTDTSPVLPSGDVERSSSVLRSGELEPAAREEAVPLPAGLFVRAEIEGRRVEDVFVVPVMALRDDDRVFVLDDEDRLRVRSVSVLRRDADRVVIDAGLAPGDRVVVSPLRIYSEGMSLRTLEAKAE